MSDKKPGNDGGFMKFLYNSDTGEVLGRTGSSWGKYFNFLSQQINIVYTDIHTYMLYISLFIDVCNLHLLMKCCIANKTRVMLHYIKKMTT